MNKATANEVLEHHIKVSMAKFDALTTSGIVSGEFYDPVWSYKSNKLNFVEIGFKKGEPAVAKPLSPTADSLARIYVTSIMHMQQSGEFAISRLNSFRHLARAVGHNDDLWVTMPTALLNRVTEQLLSNYKATTAYHRATGIKAFIQFMNHMHLRIDGIEHRYFNRLISWTHRIPNPIRSSLALTTPENEARREELYEEKLHAAIASAAFKARSSPELEPVLGYDRIRLESLAFALAMGLRVGELCSLQKDAIYFDKDTGQYGLRVATEKGAPSGINAIAQIWGPVLKDASDYLTDTCASARELAADIEKRGFVFVTEKLLSYRKKSPIPISRLKQLTSIGLDPHTHFFINEITECFSISKKSLTSEGYYRDSTVLLPQEVGAKVSIWLDYRFAEWDWAHHASYYSTSGYKLTLDTLIECSGIAKSPLTKARWFVGDLRTLLDDMRLANLFAPDRKATEDEMASWRDRWADLKETILSNRGGKSLAICTDRFIQTLKEDYSRYLSTHFKEEFNAEGNSTSGEYTGNNIRPGMQTRLSEHLVVVWQNHFNGHRDLGIIPRPMLRSDLYNYLSNKGGKKTVFERLSILNDRNEPYSISPHQIRRWLTTALLRSGPNEAAIDLWMGRQPRQTRHYDYRTAVERAEYVRAQYTESKFTPDDVLGRKVTIWRNEGISDADIEKMVCERLKALHFTPWGTCSRELYVSPCDKGLMCLRGFGTHNACASFQIDVSDLEAKTAITQLRSKYSTMLRSVTDNERDLAETIAAELNNSEPLDQHIIFILDMIKSCDSALQAYIDHNTVE